MNWNTTAYFILVISFLGLSIFTASWIKRSFPKLFSVVSSAKVVWPAALGLNLLDGLSTWLCLARSGKTNIEGNPLFRFLFEQFSVGATLLAGKIFFVSILIVLFLKFVSPRTKVAFVLFFFVLCLNNFIVLVLMGSV